MTQLIKILESTPAASLTTQARSATLAHMLATFRITKSDLVAHVVASASTIALTNLHLLLSA